MATYYVDSVNILRGDSWEASITDLGNVSDMSKLWFTVKRRHADADAGAIIQVLLTDPADPGDGLQYLNGAAGTAALASITVDDAVAGDITIEIDETATAELAPQAAYYDIQVLRTTGDVNTLTIGRADINADVTRATD